MQKLLEINDFIEKYKFIVRSIKGQYAVDKTGNPITKRYAIIKIKNLKTNSETIHPITDFIISKWKNLSFNTMKSAAHTITMFLNFLLDNKKTLEIKSIIELNFEHGTAFLNELSYNMTPKKTVKKHERILAVFFDYLIESNFLDKKELEVKRVSVINGFYLNNNIISPFKGVIYHSTKDDNSNKVLHQLPDEYILRFLETAYLMNSPIALGIYMQFLGGLRSGECCNLRLKDCRLLGDEGEYGFLLNLSADRELRNDINSTDASNYIKRKRWQFVYGFKNWSVLFYQRHFLKSNLNHAEGNKPLFINRDGLAMTGSSYYYHFNNIKHEFLKNLRQSTNSKDRLNAITLENCKWSTHIGRGIFSNLLAEEADNVYDVSFPRGDNNFESVKPYLANSRKMKEKIENKLSEMYSNELLFLD